MALFQLITVCFLIHSIFASLVNITIDDTYGDLTTGKMVLYTPPDAWKVGAQCLDCTAEPSARFAHNGTWHEGTFDQANGTYPNVPLTASVVFNGSAVWVYCITSQSAKNPDGYSDMTFSIDGLPVGNFIHTPSGQSSNYAYKVPVYSNTSLTATWHNLTLQNGHINGNESLVLLDFIVYSTEDRENPSVTSTAINPSISSSMPSLKTDAPSISASGAVSHSSRSILIIVATVVGVLVTILLAVIAFILYRRSQSDRRTNPPTSDSEGRVRGIIAPPPHSPSFYPNLFVRSAARGHPTSQSISDSLAVTGNNGGANPLQLGDQDLVAAIQEMPSDQQEHLQMLSENFNMSEVDLSSHYDSTDSYISPRPTPPRRFTVMNR